ncbi:MAG: NUDIX domain-containing protein [bacterium]|nr:NUDIX domain-containing protein [bacterium]
MPPISYRRLDTRTWTETEMTAEPHEFVTRVGGHGFLFNEEGKLLCLRFGKNNVFDLPGGGVEVGESVTDACRREFIEETGLEVEVGKPVAVSERFFSTDDQPPYHVIRIHFLVKQVGGNFFDKTSGHSPEGIPEWVSLSEINATNAIPPVLEAVRQYKEQYG